MLRTIIVDDEVNNIDNLSAMLQRHCPTVSITGSATNAVKARELIAKGGIDLLFLDIQMPKENGFDLLRSLPAIPFDVIFVTAYDHYGIQAIKMSALDYLLKPVNVEELKCAVDKAEQVHLKKQQGDLLQNLMIYLNNDKTHEQKLALPTQNETRLVSISDIIHCESSNSYTTFYVVSGEKIMVSKSIKEYEELLGAYGFLRVHQSHLVNKKYVQSLVKKDGYALLLKGGANIPLSRQRKELILKELNLL